MKRKLVVLMGLDGSGKSTQAELLRDRLRAGGVSAETVWMRGESYLTRPVLAIGKALLRAPKETKRGDGIKAGKAYDRYVGSKHSIFRSPLLRRLWTGLTLLDLYITFRAAFARLPRKTDVVILDRYIYDSFIDIDTAYGDRGKEAERLLGSTMAGLFPKPDLVLLLEIAPEEAMGRKDDIPSLSYLKEREGLYDIVGRAVGAVRVDAAGPVEEVQGRISEAVEGALR
jgi:thymidylate kinase